MKTLHIIATAIMLPCALIAASTSDSDATLLTATNISTLIKSLPASSTVDQALRTVDTGVADIGVFVVHRPEEPDQGCTIEHDTFATDKTASIFLVMKGAGTLITGGTLANPKPIAADDPDLKLVGTGNRGSGIQNGHSRRITKGDVVIIPAGVPHGFSAIGKSITYEVIRIDSGKTLPLK